MDHLTHLSICPTIIWPSSKHKHCLLKGGYIFYLPLFPLTFKALAATLLPNDACLHPFSDSSPNHWPKPVPGMDYPFQPQNSFSPLYGLKWLSVCGLPLEIPDPELPTLYADWHYNWTPTHLPHQTSATHRSEIWAVSGLNPHQMKHLSCIDTLSHKNNAILFVEICYHPPTLLYSCHCSPDT